MNKYLRRQSISAMASAAVVSLVLCLPMTAVQAEDSTVSVTKGNQTITVTCSPGVIAAFKQCITGCQATYPHDTKAANACSLQCGVSTGQDKCSVPQ